MTVIFLKPSRSGSLIIRNPDSDIEADTRILRATSIILCAAAENLAKCSNDVQRLRYKIVYQTE